MSDILNGKIKRPPDWDVVNKVVHACLTHAKQVGKPLPRNFRDEEDWRRRYDDLEQDFDAAPPPRRSTQAAAERAVKTVSQSDPFDLGELRAALHQAATGGPSVFAVLAGDSCTGKTRALYEALVEVVPDWPLLRPFDADGLLELLNERRFRPRTVLWLNETQRHLYGTSGERAATLLRSTLPAIDGAVAVGALWSAPT